MPRSNRTPRPERLLSRLRERAQPRVRGRDRAARRRELESRMPYVSLIRAPERPQSEAGPERKFTVATYNVHRFVGGSTARSFSPERACAVITELDADVVALQEVVRPFDGEDPLDQIAEDLQLHRAFVATRVHRRGELGNAVLSRWPLTAVGPLDLSFGRIEKRSAVAAELAGASGPVSIVATHLALVDRTRARQVRSLLERPELQGATVLLGDVNAWRRCRATRELDREFQSRHHNSHWPASFPAARPALALDRIYSRGAAVTDLRAHQSHNARSASDHLPVLATVVLTG